MKYIKRLQLTVHINELKEPTNPALDNVQSYQLALLVHDRLRGPKSALEDVILNVGFSPQFWFNQSSLGVLRVDEEEKIKAFLEPLRLIRELENVEIERVPGRPGYLGGLSPWDQKLHSMLVREVEGVRECMLLQLKKGEHCPFCKKYLVGQEAIHFDS